MSHHMSSMGSDPMMLELFRAELDQHLPVLNEGLLELERGRATSERVDAMMRAAHSIKGAGRVMGFDPVVRVAHALEDCFAGAKASRITLTPDAVDVLLAGIDAIQRICSPDPGDIAEEANLSALLERIAAVGAGARTAPAPQVVARPAPAAAPDLWSLPADVDAAAADALRHWLIAPGAAARREIRLDFSRVRRLGPEALGVLLGLDPERSASALTGDVTACGVRSEVRTLLSVTGLDGVMAVLD